MITTRKAVLQDIPAIHALVTELAIFEKAPDAVYASIENYKRDFQLGWFECIVAKEHDTIIGMALYYKAYSTWKGRMMYLEDFVVSEPHRRKGVGQLLFDAFLVAAKEEGAILVKWQVLDWNQTAIDFYEKNKATIEKEWYNGKLYLVMEAL